MKAWRIHAFGDISDMALDDVPPSDVADREVLIRVLAASVNAADLLIVRGLFPRIRQTDLPVTLGCDFVGIVERSGMGAGQFRAGDAVYGMAKLGEGSFAECVVAEPETLAPVHIPYEDLAAFAAIPLAALTAWQGLFRHGNVQPGQRVLILGAAGGVGHFAVQIARQAGAVVFATGSDDDAGFLTDLGAHEVVDRNAPLERKCADIDLVLDLVGGPAQESASRVLNANGAIVSAVSDPNRRLRAAGARPGCRFICQRDQGNFEQLSLLVRSGRLRPRVARRIAFAQAPEALKLLDQGGTRGKIIITY
jgi:NADPH:quinone reductase-like Zn-dependent oxidoreductase